MQESSARRKKKKESKKSEPTNVAGQIQVSDSMHVIELVKAGKDNWQK